MTMLRVRFATRGRSTTTSLGSVIVWCAKSSGFDRVSDTPSRAAIVTFDSRRELGAGVDVSGRRSSSPTCQPEGELARVIDADPAAMLPTDSTHSVLLQPTRL